MKYLIIGLLTCTILGAGCATDKEGAPNSAQKQAQEKHPEVGMTKDDVIAMYGKTDNIQFSSQGETWVYHLNMGEAFIPFNFGYRPKIRIVQFDRDGKVASWSYGQ
jgi:hypothetical protein